MTSRRKSTAVWASYCLLIRKYFRFPTAHPSHSNLKSSVCIAPNLMKEKHDIFRRYTGGIEQLDSDITMTSSVI